MSKIYTVKSNARRDARKMGLDPDAVVAVEGGFVIGGTSEPASLGAAAVAISEPAKAPAADRKNAALRAKLESGWVPAAELMTSFGWQAHTLRGAISTLAKKSGLEIERQRVEGVTQYRVKPS